MSCRLIPPALICMLLGAVPSSGAVCQKPFPQAAATQVLSAIRIMPGGNNFSIAAGTSTALNAALAQWNTVCGSNVPTLSKTASSPVTFVINYEKGVFDLDPSLRDSCGATPLPIAGTVLGGGTITIFEQTINGTDCTGLYKELTMHEIGHRLGLDHSTCSTNIMTGVVTTTMMGLNPTPADCSAVDPFWLTPEEVLPPPPPPPLNCECSFASDCLNVYGPPGWGTWSCQLCQCLLVNSPLVLHLPDYSSTGGGGQSWWKRGFCGPEAPTVCLDWRNDGNITCTAWTTPGSGIAFVVALSLDDAIRLAGGVAVRVQPWRHFFGNVTMGPRGDFPFVHGFAALAAYCGQDPEASSGIDLTTPCGLSLHVWEDRSSDGDINPDEILELQALGIESLGDVRKTGKKDACGNTFAAESHATCSDRPGKCGTLLDVFFESR